MLCQPYITHPILTSYSFILPSPLMKKGGREPVSTEQLLEARTLTCHPNELPHKALSMKAETKAQRAHLSDLPKVSETVDGTTAPNLRSAGSHVLVLFIMLYGPVSPIGLSGTLLFSTFPLCSSPSGIHSPSLWKRRPPWSEHSGQTCLIYYLSMYLFGHSITPIVLFSPCFIFSILIPYHSHSCPSLHK